MTAFEYTLKLLDAKVFARVGRANKRTAQARRLVKLVLTLWANLLVKVSWPPLNRSVGHDEKDQRSS